MKQIIHPFRRLQWKLTLSYTLITVATLFFIELLIAIIFLSFVIANEPVFLESGLQQQTLQLTPYFVQNPPDRTAITTWLHTTGLAVVCGQGGKCGRMRAKEAGKKMTK